MKIKTFTKKVVLLTTRIVCLPIIFVAGVIIFSLAFVLDKISDWLED